MEKHFRENNDKYSESGKDNDRNLENRDELDSPINKDFDHIPDSTASLTNDEDAGVDPNTVSDKPSFHNDNN